MQAYTVFANQGRLQPLTPFTALENSKKILNSEIAFLIGNILSDPAARALEFGENSVLNFPIQTAVKIGTSSDYRDSWAIGFNHR